MLKVTCETEELLLSCVCDAGAAALGTTVKAAALMQRPKRTAGAERPSRCDSRSSANSVISTGVVVVPEVCTEEVFASISVS